LGDEVNGYVAYEGVQSSVGIAPWLQSAIAHFYPESTYAKSLGEEFIEGAKTLLFQPPPIAAQVTCPHCGAPHAAPAGMTELISYVCQNCGAEVTVEPPKV